MMFLCFESITSIRNLRSSDGGGNTYQTCSAWLILPGEHTSGKRTKGVTMENIRSRYRYNGYEYNWEDRRKNEINGDLWMPYPDPSNRIEAGICAECGFGHAR